MKKILLLITFLFITQTNFAQNRRPDKYDNYLIALSSMSGLFSRLLDNIDVITHRPDRISLMNLAVNFNKKVNVLLINQNNLIALINKGGFNDHHFNNSLRIMEKNVADLKKIVVDNRGLIDQLKLSNFNSDDIYNHLDTRLYENDDLLNEIKTHHNKAAFKAKVTDNLTKAVVLLNECHDKVSALYSKLK